MVRMHTHKHTQEHTKTDRQTDKAHRQSSGAEWPVWPDHSRKGSLFSGTYIRTYVCTCAHILENLKGDMLHE